MYRNASFRFYLSLIAKYLQFLFKQKQNLAVIFTVLQGNVISRDNLTNTAVEPGY